MEFSKGHVASEAVGIKSAHAEILFQPEGAELIKQIVALTELPEGMVRQELNLILEASGRCVNDLTLDDLREAMLAYLDALHAGYFAEAETSPQIN